MKCKYCNAEIEQDAQFCTHCGKDLSKFNKCIKCGELLDNKTAFCPYCGTEQPHEETTEEPHSKKWMWIVAAVSLLVVAGGVFWFFQQQSTSEDGNIISTDTTAVASSGLTDADVKDNLTVRNDGGSEESEVVAFLEGFYKALENNVIEFEDLNSTSLAKYMTKDAMEKLITESDYEDGGVFYDVDFFTDGQVQGDQHGDYNYVISREITHDTGSWYKIFTKFKDDMPAPTLIKVKVERLGEGYMMTDVEVKNYRN